MTFDILTTRRSGVAAALVAAAVASACSGRRSPAEERVARADKAQGDVVIAAAWPWQARASMRYGDGLDLATAEINASGGINGRKLRILRVDDKESVDEGRLVAQRLGADPEVVAVIGHLQSYVTVPASAIYDLSGLLMVSPASTDPELTSRGYRRVFRSMFTDRAAGRQIAEVAAGRGLRRVAVYYMRDNYGRDLANAFEERANELGLTVVARQSYAPAVSVNEQTFAATLREWKSTPMDAVFVAGDVPSAGYLIAAARRHGITVPILGSDAMSTPELITAGGDAVEGTTVLSVFHPDEPRAEVKKFSAAFEERYHARPDAVAALGYDAVQLVAHAMRSARSVVPDRVAAALRATRDWRGVTGTFTFNDAGDPMDRRAVTLVVRHGKFEYQPAPVLALDK